MRLLVVRACAVGDFVLHLPALRALAAAEPSARFTLVGYPATLALARTFIPVDAIHSIELPPWSRLFTDAAPIPHFDRAWVWMKDRTVAENLRKSGVSEVFLADPFPAPTSRVHAAEHLLRTVDLPAPELPDLWQANKSAILHPGSGSTSKLWPHFGELARSLPDAKVLLGPADLPFNAANECLKDRPLTDVVEELRQCRFFVGNDSGITHIAAYWGAPTVALFGPTDPKVWGPLGRRVKVVSKPALTDISVDEVRKLL